MAVMVGKIHVKNILKLKEGILRQNMIFVFVFCQAETNVFISCRVIYRRSVVIVKRYI